MSSEFLFVFITYQNYANAELDKTELLMNFKNRMLSTEIEYYQEIRNIKKENKKNFQISFKKHSLHIQTTPGDGLWRIRKRSGQFR